MSTTVDSRVVEMRFDNKQFEANVSNTMSTLDKLKQKLGFKGATTGLENVGKAANNVNMSGLGSAVETVRSRFSALEVMGVTALANITNSAVNAGKRMLSALTIDPVKTGFSEYELKMDSVRTIMASTGESIETVNEYLRELNTYSDETIYSFADMTQNIGKFTNAGVKLEDAVLAIKGISNEAAVSGANANEASRAMYNFAQALSAGHVKLIDWKSIELANMATKEFKEQLLESAVACGTLTKTSDGMYQTLEGNTLNATKNFNETLQDQWMTTDVLIGTLKDYADETTEIGKKAKAAAQDVTKFSQVFDILKETAQSGWAETWEIIFGNINQAKALFTPLTEFLQDILAKTSKWRNDLLAGALGRGFGNLKKQLDNLLEPAKKTADAVSKVVDAVKDYSQVVDDIIGGKWGNGQARWDKLAESGYDWAHAQNLVNEKLGNAKRHATDYKEAQDAVNKSQEKGTEAQKKLSKEEAKRIEQLANMSEAQLKNLDYSDKQIKAFKELKAVADKLGLPISELITNIDEINGRWLLMNSFKNIGQGLVAVFTSIGKAWREIFKPITSEHLFNVIAGFHKLSTKLRMSDKNADKLKRTFKGLFAILDIVTTIFGGAFKIAFKAVTTILGMFDLNILDVTAAIGDAIVGFRNWFKSTFDLAKAFEKIVPSIKNVAKSFGEWIDKLKKSDNIPRDIILGLVNGLIAGTKAVWNAASGIGKAILDSIKKILGIHSPSTEGHSIGVNFILGIMNGIKFMAEKLFDIVKNVMTSIVEWTKGLDFGTVFAAVFAGGMLSVGNKISTALLNFSQPFEAIADVIEQTAKVVKSFSKLLKAQAFNLRTKGIKNLSVSLLMLVGAIAILTLLDPDRLTDAVIVVAELASILIGLSFAIDQLNSTSIGFNKDGKKLSANLDGLKTSLLSIGAAILLLGLTVKIIGSMDPDKAKQGIEGLAYMVLAMAGVLAAFSVFTQGKGEEDMKDAAKLIKKIGTTLLILAIVAKILGGMSWESMGKAMTGLIGFAGIVTILVLISKIARDESAEVGYMISKIATAMLILVVVAKLIAGMSWEAMGKAAAGMLGLVGIISLLALITKIVGGDAPKIGATIVGIAGAMLVLTFVGSIIALMSWKAMGKALVGMTGLIGVIALMMLVVKMAGSDAPKIAGTLMALSVAVGILAGIAVLLSLVKGENLVKGIAAIGALAGIMSVMILATSKAKDCKANLIVMTVAIGVMAAAIATLSFIDGSKLAGATAALGVLMGMFALMAKASKDVTDSMWSLLIIAGIVVVFAGILVAMSLLKVDSALSNAAALSTLMLSMAAVCKLVSGMNPMAAVQGALALSAFIGIMAGLMTLLVAVFGGLAKIPGINEFMAKGGELLGTIGYAIGNFIGSIIGGFGAGVTSGLPAIADNLSAFADRIGPFIEKMSEVASNGDAVLKGVGVMTASILALTVANFLSGITKFLTMGQSFADLGLQLSAFIYYAQPFIDGVQKINASAMEGAKALSEVILALTASNLLSGISRFIGGSNSMAVFAEQLPALGDGLSNFSKSVKNVDSGKIEEAAKAAGAIAKMADAIPNSGGLIAVFTGDNDLGKFATKLPMLGEGLSDFSKSIKTIDSSKSLEAVKVVSAIVEMAKEIPNEGMSVARVFVGDNSLSTFSGHLPTLGENLSDFSRSIRTIDSSKSLEAVKVVSAIVDMAKEIPNEGMSVARVFVGDNSLSTFAGHLPTLGENLSDFSSSVRNIKGDQSLEAVKVVSAIVKIAKEIPNEGLSFASVFVGDNSLSDFADHLPTLGEGLKGFSDSVKNIRGDDSMDAVKIAKAIGDLTTVDVDKDGKKLWFTGDEAIAKDSEDLKNLGEALKAFATETKGVKSEKSSGALEIAKTIGDLTALDIDKDGKKFWFTGEDAIAKDATSLENLGAALYGFYEETKDINDDASINASKVAEAIGGLTSVKINKDGKKFWFTGEDAIAKDATSLENLGAALYGFYEETKDMKGDTATNAADVAKSIAGIAKIKPDKDGKKFWFTGEDAIAKDAASLENLGKALSGFYNATKDMTGDTATNAVGVAESLVALSKKKLDGDAFASWMQDDQAFDYLGDALFAFYDKTKDINTDNATNAVSVAQAIADLASIKITSDMSDFWFSDDYTKFENLAGALTNFNTAASALTDTTGATGALGLAKTIAGITEISPDADGLELWFTGTTSLAKTPSLLGNLGSALASFHSSTAGLTDKTGATNAVAIAESIAGMTAVKPDSEGLDFWFSTTNGVGIFTQLTALGQAIVAFHESTSGLTDTTGATNAVTIAERIAQMTAVVPDAEGLGLWFGSAVDGETGLASKCENLGSALEKFTTSTSGITDVTGATNAVTVAENIAGLAAIELNKDGLDFWFGLAEDGSSTVIAKITNLGSALGAFHAATVGLSDKTGADNAVAIANAIADLTKIEPTKGGLDLWFGTSGDADMADKMTKLGEALAAFYNATIGLTATEGIDNSVTIANTISELSDITIGGADLATFSTEIEGLGISISAFHASISGVSTETIGGIVTSITGVTDIPYGNLESIAEALDTLTSSMKSVAGIEATSVSGVSEALTTLGQTSSENFLSGFDTLPDDMITVAENVISSFSSGITDNTETAKTAANDMAKAAAKKATKKKTFKEAGKACVEGFADGITENIFMAEAEAKAMAEAALEAAKEAMDSHSPSREFYKLGRWGVLGFVNAFSDNERLADRAGSGLAQASIDSLNSTISRISDAINSDIDSQPVITPILDLSDVRSGARSLNDMFGVNRTLSINAGNVRAISTDSLVRQNGFDSHELTSSIEKAVRRGMADTTVNSYNINGITYDDGSNIANAMEAIARQALVERRI